MRQTIFFWSEEINKKNRNAESTDDSDSRNIIARRSFLQSALIAVPALFAGLPLLTKANEKKQIDQKAVTATIYVEGLAISCFNTAEGRYEAAFLRHEEHSFIINVTKKRNGAPVETKTYIVAPDDKIEIFGIKPSTSGFKTYQSGNFIRTTEERNDPEDLRWIVDIKSEVHGLKLNPTKHSARNGLRLTRLYIKNAEFYTKRKTDFPAYLLNENREVLKEFGKVGDVIGAKLDAEKVIIKVTGATSFELNLLKERDETYEIYIRNTREVHSGHVLRSGDFQEYYNILTDPRGKKFDLVSKKLLEDLRSVSLSYPTISYDANLQGKLERLEKVKFKGNSPMYHKVLKAYSGFQSDFDHSDSSLLDPLVSKSAIQPDFISASLSPDPAMCNIVILGGTRSLEHLLEIT